MLEHKALWCTQQFLGKGVSKIADNLKDPSDLIAAGKFVVNTFSSALDSVKCGYAYVSAFMGSSDTSEIFTEAAE